MRKRIVSFFVTALMAVTTLSPATVMAECTDTTGHSWGEWKQVDAKSYSNIDGESGSIEKFERKCTTCSETEEGVITKSKKPATCTEDGYETILNTMNPEEDVNLTVKKTGHTPGEWEEVDRKGVGRPVTPENLYEQDWTEFDIPFVKKCKNCNEILETAEEYETIYYPTCVEDGYTEYRDVNYHAHAVKSMT